MGFAGFGFGTTAGNKFVRNSLSRHPLVRIDVG